MSSFWLADSNLNSKLENLIEKYHQQRIVTPAGQCKIAIALTDSKAFVNDKINWGKIKKFNRFNKVWMHQDFDYCIVLSSDLLSILKDNQKEAIIDLHLSRIHPQYEPNKVTEDGKKVIVKDEYGRIEYSDQIKLDKDGNPKWFVDSMDLQVFANNIKRFGFWCEDLVNFQNAIKNK